MSKKYTVRLSELISATPEKREELLWGDNSRRDFFKKTTLASVGMLLGGHIVFAKNMPLGHLPIGLVEGEGDIIIPHGKNQTLTILNDKPWNVETPAHLLDDDVTDLSNMFIRNNGLLPDLIDPEKWMITISGESAKAEKSYTLNDLKRRFEEKSLRVTLECGGNGRHEFDPPAKGNQWTTGAVSFAKWTGVLLRDILKDVGIKDDAVYIGYYARDQHLSKDPTKHPISRGVPIQKALSDHVLIAYKVNDQDIPLFHGQPVRLIAPGYPASASGKWIDKIVVRNIVHDGNKMLTGYRVPKNPVQPGETVEPEDMKIIESMPAKSLITYPKTGAMLKGKTTLSIRGKAWAGEQKVSEMHISIDFGATWKKCKLAASPNVGAWQTWEGDATFPTKGYYEVWAKATDENGISQPMLVPGWNPKGYLNNACHRIAVKVL